MQHFLVLLLLAGLQHGTSLAGGFAKKQVATRGPKYDGKKSMLRHMKAYKKLQASDFSNVRDIYVRSPSSDKVSSIS